MKNVTGRKSNLGPLKVKTSLEVCFYVLDSNTGIVKNLNDIWIGGIIYASRTVRQSRKLIEIFLLNF